jgi:HAE1 family hydrophobic/amphiphilic exporter-1
MSSAGSGGPGGRANTGRIFMRLKPRNERPSADQMVQSLRRRLATVEGVQASPQNRPPIQIGGRAGRGQYQYTLTSPDTEELYRHVPRLLEKMRQMGDMVLDLNSDMQLKNPELNVEINRDLASSLGVTVAQIESALLGAYGSRQVSTIFAPNNQYQVILEVPTKYQMNASALSLLHVRSSSGKLIPLSVLAGVREDVGPLSINHTGQLPSVTVSFNLEPGVPLSTALERIDQAARDVLPPTINASFQGTAQAFQESTKGLGMLLVLAIVVIYIVLGILYENFWHPVTILSALPFAGVGALLTLMMFGAELAIYAYVGIIMLVGLVKKNGIMMVDFAIEARREGLPPAEAIHRACMIRFRPIMMTTMAALMAGLPIAIGWGAGGEARRPLGLAVVGGLLFSQTLTLYVTPVFYCYMEKLQEFIRRKSARSVTP